MGLLSTFGCHGLTNDSRILAIQIIMSCCLAHRGSTGVFLLLQISVMLFGAKGSPSQGGLLYLRVLVFDAEAEGEVRDHYLSHLMGKPTSA